jgi:hypothetical protein
MLMFLHSFVYKCDFLCTNINLICFKIFTYCKMKFPHAFICFRNETVGFCTHSMTVIGSGIAQSV